MRSHALHSNKVLLPKGVSQGYVVIENGTIASVSKEAPLGLTVEELGDSWLAPGFVDTHIHGSFGTDVMQASPDELRHMCEALARTGTTSILATTLTASAEETEAACVRIGKACDAQSPEDGAARIEGIFLEGPFFSEKYSGAQNPAYLCDPSIELLDRWQKASGGHIVKSALAPEKAHAHEYILACKERGIVCALGHSDASYEEALAAYRVGASVFVHTFNAMRPLHHRDPGVVGAAMTLNDAYAEIICDGIHVAPAAVSALIKAKGYQHVALITDALACAGMPEGNYTMAEVSYTLRDSAAYLTGTNTLAGSVLTMAQAVKNLVLWGVATQEQALRMASEVPARSAHIPCGEIAPGRAANLVVLSEDLELEHVYVCGRAVTI